MVTYDHQIAGIICPVDSPSSIRHDQVIYPHYLEDANREGDLKGNKAHDYYRG